ncbi:MAG: quinone-dependent dihydroorotate dehydrogenase [Paracoccaceae bacterium]
MKKLLQKLGLPALHLLDPEVAHGLGIKALKMGLTPTPGAFTTPRLATELAGMALPNPVGLAAGFDKNAEAIAPLLQSGFGFVEVGAATPRTQAGNPKPRLFRLSADAAVINRFGFNNQGMEAISARLAHRPAAGILGINLGANKNSQDKAADFATVLESCGPYVDFATVNVSSPNTERLRDLQGKAVLERLLVQVMETRKSLPNHPAIFLKIAPDLEMQDLEDITEVALSSGISGIIATNTTLSREGLHSAHAAEAGGLSGQPLFEKSTRVLARLSALSCGKLPLIGVGGIGSGAQAYAKIQAGASAVQLYSAMVYKGIGLAREIAQELDVLLARDGFTNLAEAVGTKQKEWL